MQEKKETKNTSTKMTLEEAQARIAELEKELEENKKQLEREEMQIDFYKKLKAILDEEKKKNKW